MKRFKTFFYPVYIITIIFVLMMAFNIYDTLELFKRWGWFKYFSDLPFMVRDMMVFLTLLMSIELILENFAIFNNRGKVKKLEKEIVALKAKLYDQSQDEAEEETEELEIAGDDDDEDDDD